MSAKDDDSTLTQLATAWVDMYLGGAKVKEAFDIFQELGDKYNWTVRVSLLNTISCYWCFALLQPFCISSCYGRAPHHLALAFA